MDWGLYRCGTRESRFGCQRFYVLWWTSVAEPVCETKMRLRVAQHDSSYMPPEAIVALSDAYQKSLVSSYVCAVLLSQELFNVINAADMDLRADFYKHIVLSGGTTMFPGTAFVTSVLFCLRDDFSVKIMHANFCNCPNL